MSPSPEKDVPDGGASPPPDKLMSSTQQPEEERSEAPGEDAGEGAQQQQQQQQQEEGNEEGEVEEEEEEQKEKKSDPNPPLPNEDLPPPLPHEAPPRKDDGWEPVWDARAGAYYFYNRFTGVSQWENPRVPDTAAAPTKENDEGEGEGKERDTTREGDAAAPVVGGYNPAIHGDYDPTAPYAQLYERQPGEQEGGSAGPGNPSRAAGMAGYEATGTFNRFTGRWQVDENQNSEYHNAENKARRQMNAFFDVDAAANSHDGRSLRAERSAKKLSKKELKMFKEKRREKKEEKRRAWLRD